MNKIDLEKILVKELPSKTIKANFDGTAKNFQITAMSDGDRSTFAAILADREDVLRAKKIHVFLLVAGLGLEQEVAEFLYDNVSDESIRVAHEIFNFDQEFIAAKAKEQEEAEKNSIQSAVPPELPQADTAL